MASNASGQGQGLGCLERRSGPSGQGLLTRRPHRPHRLPAQGAPSKGGRHPGLAFAGPFVTPSTQPPRAGRGGWGRGRGASAGFLAAGFSPGASPAGLEGAVQLGEPPRPAPRSRVWGPDCTKSRESAGDAEGLPRRRGAAGPGAEQTGGGA